MGLMNWVQSKLNKGGQDKKRSDSDFCLAHRTSVEEEFSDWPEGLLAIGTFGVKDELKEDPQRHHPTETSHSSQDLLHLSPQEVIKLQKELKKLLSRQAKSSSNDPNEKEGDGPNLLPLSIEVDRTGALRLRGDGEDGDILAERRNSMKQRSISFLLKKMFVCRGGFPPPAPSLRDPVESRMEKLLKTILHKKIYPQSSGPAASMKKYLEKKRSEDKEQEKGEDGFKWVKTDSEFIVLEI